MKITAKTTEYLIKAIRFLSIHRIAAFILLFVFFYLPVGVILGTMSMPVPYFLRKSVQIKSAHAADTGATSSGTSLGGNFTINSVAYGDNWSWNNTGTPGNAAANDSNYLVPSASRWDTEDGDGLEFSNFSFSLPADSTVDGVVVEILAWYYAGGPARWVDGQLMTATNVYCGTDEVATTVMPDADPVSTYQSFGGSGNSWGCTLTETEVNNSGFGIAMGPDCTGDNTYVNIDHVRMTVYYTVAVAAAAYTQNNFRFYLDNDLLTPTEPWGNPDLGEKSVVFVLPISNDAPASGSQMRLRFNIAVTVGNLAATTQAFRLKYVAGDDCPNIAAGSYSDVGASTSNEIWRFTDGWTDGATLFPFVLSDSTTTASGAYMESNPSTTNPVAVDAGETMEWDASLQNNGAADATKYCFRIHLSDDSNLNIYNSDSFPAVETPPGTGDLMRHGNFFASEVEKGFFWAD